MIKNSIRTLGIALFLAGGIVYIVQNASPEAKMENGSEKAREMQQIKEELAATKEELAKLQAATSASGFPVSQEKTSDKPETKSDAQNGTTSTTVTKTLLIIQQGMNSSQVAKTLELSGIIQDAKVFEQYLADHKMTGKIQIGEYEVDSSMSIETLAKIVTRSK